MKIVQKYIYVDFLSVGLQEYIEALSFYYYIKHKDLIPLTEVEGRLHFTPPFTDVSVWLVLDHEICDIFFQFWSGA